MVVIHRAFRRESRLLASLIAAVPDGDTRRARVLAAHLRWYQRGLHNHHAGEDELLWPLLHARADFESEVVLRMEAQHERVAASLDQVMACLPAWQASARTPERDRLVAALTAHRAVVLEHLDDEEAHLLPVAARHLTRQEWDAQGEHFAGQHAEAPVAHLPGRGPGGRRRQASGPACSRRCRSRPG